MKIFCIVKDGKVTTSSSHPICENGVIAEFFEVDEEEFNAVAKGEKEFVFEKGELVAIDKNYDDIYKAIDDAKKRKLELVAKVTKGEATKKEQEEFANLL